MTIFTDPISDHSASLHTEAHTVPCLGDPVTDRIDPRCTQCHVFLSMDQRSPVQQDSTWQSENGTAIAAEDTVTDVDRRVKIFPSNLVNRRTVSWNGISLDVVQTTSDRRIEIAFCAPSHLLIAYQRGVRRKGETFVEGLPPSDRKDVQHRLSFVPAGHTYREWHDPEVPFRIAYFYFDPAWLSVSRDIAAKALEPKLFLHNGMLWGVADKAVALVESGSNDRRYFGALGTVLAHELVRLHAAPQPETRPARGGLAAWQRRLVTEYIEEHLTQKVSLTELAQLARLSRYHFCRAFKLTLGVPPLQYQKIRRIERAKSLLAEQLSVTEIGVMTGFSDTSSFTATFRKLTGSTPTAYRRSI